MELPLATWAVLGMTIARAQFTHSEWQAELSLTEMQRRLGGAGRKTVVAAVTRLEKAGLVRAIRKRRNRRFSEVNVSTPGGRLRRLCRRMRHAPLPDPLPWSSGSAGAPRRRRARGRLQSLSCGLSGSREGTFAGAATIKGKRRPSKAHGRLPASAGPACPGVHPISTVHPSGLIDIQRKILLQNYKETAPSARNHPSPSPAQARTAKPDIL
ncbi:MAG: hypothetical protein J4F40_16695 [Alphaproteobacteria bacterium]|nr:hypothetical protein [Alphaproteobacteria bacterium]